MMSIIAELSPSSIVGPSLVLGAFALISLAHKPPARPAAVPGGGGGGGGGGVEAAEYRALLYVVWQLQIGLNLLAVAACAALPRVGVGALGPAALLGLLSAVVLVVT